MDETEQPPTTDEKAKAAVHATVAGHSGETLLATHPRAVGGGARIVDEKHWDGPPTGSGRRVTAGDGSLPRPRRQNTGPESGPLAALLNRTAVTQVEAGRRPLSVYDELCFSARSSLLSSRATRRM
ncbi:hypothetical protein [Streptomyces sp. NPDC055886]